MTEQLEIPTVREGLTLRELSLDDAQAYYDAVAHDRAHLSQFGDNTGTYFQRVDMVEAAISSAGTAERQMFGIWDDDQFAGSAYRIPTLDGSAWDIGYWLNKRFTGRGIASLAANAVARYALQDSQRSVVCATVHNDNHASQRVIGRASFSELKKTELFTVFRFKEAAKLAVSATILYQDEQTSVAQLELLGRNRAAINHGSTTTYRLTDGAATMVINGLPEKMPLGKEIVVPAGTHYWDNSPLGATIIATSQPPFNPATVEYLE